MARALTDIKHGTTAVKSATRTRTGEYTPESERAGDFKTITAGSKLNKKDFSDEEWQSLLDVGAVSEDDSAEATPTPAVAGTSEPLTDKQIEATAQGEGQSGAPAPEATESPAEKDRAAQQEALNKGAKK